MIRSLLLMTAAFLLQLNANATDKSNRAVYKMPAGITVSDYLHNTIILRVKEDFRSLCSQREINVPAVQKIFNEINVQKVERIFPNHNPPASLTNEQGQRLIDLSLLYIVEYKAQQDLVKNINRLLATGVFVYAEPKFIPQVVAYTPNDPLIGQQGFLNIIAAYQAWNVSQGDTNVVIGITDTGTDTDHPDLVGNVKFNYADPVNGIDDDNDGFIDNYYGWDVGENDNNTQVGNCGTCTHGSHVSGCAAAVTDNGTGVASTGFKCKYLPVKIANANGALTGAYEGIVYAADHGCQIINCSWGGGGGSSFGQDIVDYATFNKNSLVMAAAGNNASTTEFFPAAYEHVLCVAATNSSDVKASFSNYGTYVDVCAPGASIYATYFDDTYSAQSGTSMACPVAAGAAGLIKSMFPNYNALQVGEQLRITADNIYNIPGNVNYQFQLGSGRINLLNALTITGPSVRMDNITTVDNNDNILVINDTMSITGDIINYLDPTVNLVVTLTSTSPYVTIIDGTTTVGALGTLAVTNNNADPFTVRINPNAPQNAKITFRLLFTDGSYSAYQSFTVTVNVDYINIINNDVFTTNTSRGKIGYNSDNQADGLGFDYNEEGTLLYEGGLMIGTPFAVSDVVRGNNGATPDEDFNPLLNVMKNDPGVWSDFDTYGTFNDVVAPNPLNLFVRHRTMSWTNPPFNKFHIWEYSIKNTGIQTLTSLYAGIFADWDIQTFANNKAAEDAGLKMGYVWCTDAGGYYAGIKLLTQGNWNHYAIDNVGTGSGGVNLSDGYSDSEKYQTLSTARATAGGAGAGNDVIDVVSSGPFNLLTNDSAVVAFALIAGVELSDLQSSAAQAQIKYDLVTSVDEADTELLIASPFPNPAYDKVTIPFYLKQGNVLNLELMDASGRVILTKSLGRSAAGYHELSLDLAEFSGGMYYFRIIGEKVNSGGVIQKM